MRCLLLQGRTLPTIASTATALTSPLTFRPPARRLSPCWAGCGLREAQSADWRGTLPPSADTHPSSAPLVLTNAKKSTPRLCRGSNRVNKSVFANQGNRRIRIGYDIMQRYVEDSYFCWRFGYLLIELFSLEGRGAEHLAVLNAEAWPRSLRP